MKTYVSVKKKKIHSPNLIKYAWHDWPGAHRIRNDLYVVCGYSVEEFKNTL